MWGDNDLDDPFFLVWKYLIFISPFSLPPYAHFHNLLEIEPHSKTCMW